MEHEFVDRIPPRENIHVYKFMHIINLCNANPGKTVKVSDIESMSGCMTPLKAYAKRNNMEICQRGWDIYFMTKV